MELYLQLCKSIEEFHEDQNIFKVILNDICKSYNLTNFFIHILLLLDDSILVTSSFSDKIVTSLDIVDLYMHLFFVRWLYIMGKSEILRKNTSPLTSPTTPVKIKVERDSTPTPISASTPAAPIGNITGQGKGAEVPPLPQSGGGKGNSPSEGVGESKPITLSKLMHARAQRSDYYQGTGVFSFELHRQSSKSLNLYLKKLWLGVILEGRGHNPVCHVCGLWTNKWTSFYFELLVFGAQDAYRPALTPCQSSFAGGLPSYSLVDPDGSNQWCLILNFSWGVRGMGRSIWERIKLGPLISSVASPVCQEGQSERNFLPFSSRFFLFFPDFCWFLAFFCCQGWHSAPLPPQWLRHCHWCMLM